MATKLSNIFTETKHFDNFRKYIPNHNLLCEKTINLLLEKGIIQVSTAFEYALANVGNFTVVSESGRDGSDGSDAKLATVRFRANGTAYSAQVSSVASKTGKLRVQIYEKIHDKFYYFVIPHYMYCNIKYLEIPFNLDGSPQKITSRGIFNKWWQFEVKNFEQLSKA